MPTTHEQQSQDTAVAAAESATTKSMSVRVDAAHQELPLLLRMPDLREVMADEIAEHEEIPDEEIATTELPFAESVDDEAPVTGDAPLEVIDDEPEPDTTANTGEPNRVRRGSAAAWQSWQSASQLTGKIPDRLFWTSIAVILCIVGFVIWLNGGSNPAPQPPAEWDPPGNWSQPIVTLPEDPNPTTLPNEEGLAPGEDPLFEGPELVEDPGPTTDPLATQDPPIGPTLEDPSFVPVPSNPTTDQLINPLTDVLPPRQPRKQAGEPGVARLQGIIETPDMRANKNDRTQPSLY